VKQQVNLVRKDGGKIIDVRLPGAIECGGKDYSGVVIENYEPQVVDRSDSIRILLAFTCEPTREQLAHAFRASWLERTDQSELV
jgi:hypothetical protein